MSALARPSSRRATPAPDTGRQALRRKRSRPAPRPDEFLTAGGRAQGGEFRLTRTGRSGRHVATAARARHIVVISRVSLARGRQET